MVALILFEKVLDPSRGECLGQRVATQRNVSDRIGIADIEADASQTSEPSRERIHGFRREARDPLLVSLSIGNDRSAG